MKGGAKKSKCPFNDVIADALENIYPVISHGYAGIHRIKVKQANAKAGSETDEGNAG